MKRVLTLLMALMLVFGLVGCGGGTSGGGEKPAGGDEGGVTALKLASHNAVVEGNTYRVRYEKDIQEAAAAAKDYGYDISYASFVSNWDAAVEAQQIQNSINEGYDIILVNPVAPTGMDPLIEKAQDAGILYINADCIYTSPDVDILNIATDQYYLGYKTGTEAARVLGDGAKVVMMEALQGNQANTDRQAGFEQAIKEHNLQVVATGAHNWDGALAQSEMTRILNSGVEFDGVLISQSADTALAAFEATGTPYPKFMGFHDSGNWMQQCLEINKDGRVMDFVVLSNPPGVGASALNFGINLLQGKELKDGIYDDETIHSILLESREFYTYDTMEEFRAKAEAMDPGDTLTYWLTVDEVANEYFK